MIYLTQADIDRESKLIKEESYRRKLKTELQKQGISYFENAPTKELKGQLNKGKEDNRGGKMELYICDKCGDDRESLAYAGDEQINRCKCGGLYELTEVNEDAN